MPPIEMSTSYSQGILLQDGPAVDHLWLIWTDSDSGDGSSQFNPVGICPPTFKVLLVNASLLKFDAFDALFQDSLTSLNLPLTSVIRV